MRPTATNRKVSWFFREHEQGTVDLSPDFQRRPVWNDDQASYLVDTVLHGVPFPEIYVRSKTTPSGHTTYDVVDGQQRIRALLQFARNDLVLTGKEVAARLVGRSFDDLSDEEKVAFWEYDVVVRDLEAASDSEIRELFRRLNISAVNLNDQELRHAKYTGEFISLMEELADDAWWVEHKVVSVAQVRRMLDVEYVSELFVSVMAGPQDKKKALERYYEDFENSFPDKARWRRTFNETRDRLEQLLEPQDIVSWSGKSDFYSLFSVVSRLVQDRRKFTPRQIRMVTAELRKFRGRVDLAKRKDNRKKFPVYVSNYVEAVTRAATDIARRQVREEVIMKRVEHALGA